MCGKLWKSRHYSKKGLTFSKGSWGMEFPVFQEISETPCISIDKLRAGAHGIILATEEKILPWIQNGNKSSADELGVIFLGNPTTAIDDVYQPTPISFAAMNQEGKECILRGTLLQLGAKKVSLNQHFKIEGGKCGHDNMFAHGVCIRFHCGKFCHTDFIPC